MKILYKPVLICLILMVSIVGCSNEEDKKLSHFNKGNEYFEAQEYKKAEIEFKNAIQIDNRYTDALLKLGETMMKLGQAKESFAAYSQVEKISPDDIQALINLAKFYLLDKKQEEAKTRIEKVLGLDENNIEALYLKAQILTEQKEFQTATNIFEKILDLKMDHVPSLQGLARLKSFQKDFDQAEALLLQAVAAAPNTTQPRFVLFSYYIAQKDLSNAEEQLKLSAAENPDNPDHQIVLGNFYLNTNNRPLAEAAYKKAVDISPDKTKSYLSLAGFYDVTNQDQQALEMYEKAITIDPEDINTKLLLARFQYKNKRVDESEKLVSQILEQRPKFSPANELQSEILIFKREFEKAILLLSDLEKEEPNNPRVHYFKGLCQIALGDTDQAAASVAKAVELNPAYLKAHLLLADIYFHQQSFELATKQASEVLNLDGSTERALMIRGDSNLAQGKFKEAEQDYHKIVETSPDNPAGYFRLANLKSGLKLYDEAEAYLEKAYARNNQLLDVFTLRVKNRLVLKQIEQAHDLCLDQLEIARDNKQNQALIYNVQAAVFIAEKKVDDAKRSYEKAIETDPDYLVSYNSLAQIFLAQNELNAAKDQYTKMLDKNSKLAPPHMMLGTIYEAENDYARAEDHYRKALEINPDFAAAANNLAYHLAERTDKFDEALRYARKAKEAFPEDPGIMDTLGFAYYKKELYGNAVSELLDSLKKLPDNPIVHFHLGLAYNKKGDKELARKELSRALEINKEFPGADIAQTLLEELQ